MESFTMHIDRRVRESPAYHNPFFDNCHDPQKQTSVVQVADMAVNWYFVTKSFGISASIYTGVIAQELMRSDPEKEKVLKDLLVESARISGDDLGIGHESLYPRGGGREIPYNERVHYRLWGDLTKTLLSASQHPTTINGLKIEEAQSHGQVRPETVGLVKMIEGEFRSVEGGAAVYQTVESIALNIVLAYSGLIKRLQKSGKVTLTERDLIYLKIHEPLEREHDLQSTHIIDLVDQYSDGKNRSIIKTKVDEMSGLFGNFWDAMNKIVFNE